MLAYTSRNGRQVEYAGSTRKQGGPERGERPWQLRTRVTRQWRGFPEKMRALAVSEDELAAVAAGRGADGAEVVRAWSIADGGPGEDPPSRSVNASTVECFCRRHIANQNQLKQMMQASCGILLRRLVTRSHTPKQSVFDQSRGPASHCYSRVCSIEAKPYLR